MKRQFTNTLSHFFQTAKANNVCTKVIFQSLIDHKFNQYEQLYRSKIQEIKCFLSKHPISLSLAAAPVTSVNTAENITSATVDAMKNTPSNSINPELATIFGEHKGAIQPVAMSAEHSTITQFLLDMFIQLQEVTGLPYWGVIILTTVLLRISLLPVQLFQMKQTAISQFIAPLVKQELERLNKDVTDFAKRRENSLRSTNIYSYFGTSPFKPMVPLVFMIPFYILYFFFLRAAIQDPSIAPLMMSGGISPFKDLTLPDSTYVMPSLAALATLGSIEINTRATPSTNPKLTNILRWVMRVFAVATVPILANFPVGLFYYWITNTMITTGFITLGRTELYRKLVKLPSFAMVKKMNDDPMYSNKLLEPYHKNIPFKNFEDFLKKKTVEAPKEQPIMFYKNQPKKLVETTANVQKNGANTNVKSSKKKY